MTPLRVLEYICRSPEPVSCSVIAETFGISKTTVDKYLQGFKASGDVVVTQIRNYQAYSGRSTTDEERVKPRHIPEFKPLKSVPSALGTREGSNDHLQYKSKHT